jgi:hypothetical protein
VPGPPFLFQKPCCCTGEREQARQTLIESAARYLDAGGELEATVLEVLSAGSRLVIDLKVLPESLDLNDHPSLQDCSVLEPLLRTTSREGAQGAHWET